MRSSVAVTGGTKYIPIDFTAAAKQLQQLSLGTASLPVSGTTQIVSWNGVYLNGTNPKLNVFQVSAGSLSSAPYIEVNVPSNATAIINVSDAAATVGNSGMSIVGTDKQHVLWNFYQATALTIHSISFEGSVLAPLAAVQINSGNIEGNVVSASLSSSGGGELHFFPFAGFGVTAGPQTTVSITYPRLYAGCRYSLSLPITPLSSSGACLDKTQSVGFRVAGGKQDTFLTETTGVINDGTTPGMFNIREGVHIPTQEMFTRYAAKLGLGPNDQMVAAARFSPPSQMIYGGKLKFYRQMHGGVPIYGYGVYVDEKNGDARQVLGRFAPNLALSSTPTVSAGAAISAASSLLNGVYPWQGSGDLHAPTAALLIVGVTDHPAPTDFHLVWRVSFYGTGVITPKLVDVDASTGAVILTYSDTHASSCLGVTTTEGTLAIQEPATQTGFPNATVWLTLEKSISDGSFVGEALNTTAPETQFCWRAI